MKRLVTALRHPAEYEWWALRPWRRHSLVLVVAGGMYISIGVAYIFGPSNPIRDSALRVPLTLLPISCWGVLFLGAGAMAILSSRWPPASDTWGYSALSGISTLWAAFYLWGIALGAGLGAAPGVLVWTLVSFMWWAIAGLHNSEDVVAPTEGA